MSFFSKRNSEVVEVEPVVEIIPAPPAAGSVAEVDARIAQLEAELRDMANQIVTLEDDYVLTNDPATLDKVIRLQKQQELTARRRPLLQQERRAAEDNEDIGDHARRVEALSSTYDELMALENDPETKRLIEDYEALMRRRASLRKGVEIQVSGLHTPLLPHRVDRLNPNEQTSVTLAHPAIVALDNGIRHILDKTWAPMPEWFK